jgi:hypothetical protein
MSSDTIDAAAYYYQFRLTVYDNLFVGIVYGEGLGHSPLLLRFLSHAALHHRRLYCALRYLGLRLPVRLFVLSKERR